MGILDQIAKLANPFTNSPSDESNLLQRQLEQQVANLRAGANPSNSPSLAGGAGGSLSSTTDPLQALQDQLIQQMNSIPSYQTPLDQLRKQAESQIDAQYDPLIGALAQQMGITKKRGLANEDKVRGMYNALSSDFKSDIPGMAAQSQAAEADTSNRYANAQKEMKGDYQKQSDAQQALLQQLGIQAAAPAANSQQQADQTYYSGQSDLEKQSALDALKEQAASQQDYQSNLASTTKMAGVNAATDIGSQLEEYLQQAQGQMGMLQSQKSSGLEALLAQMQGQDAQAANTQRQQEIDNLMALSNFQLSAAKAQQKNGSANNSSFRGTSGPQGAANYLAESLGADKSGTASQILQLINDTMGNKDVIQGKHQTGIDPYGTPQYTPNTDQYIEHLLRKKMESAGGYQTGDINSAINALLAYLGKLR